MFYRLSSDTTFGQIEEKSGSTFKHPNLYSPTMLIDGMEESSLSLITMENPKLIDFAIWGLMPNGYKEDWTTFQNSQNTLNTSLQEIMDTFWMFDALSQRRSLILVSGFFTYYLKNGSIYPYYISMQNEEPFFLGSIYNTLEDGFLSCSMLTTDTDEFISGYHNLNTLKPLIITDSIADTWLDPDTELNIINRIVSNPPQPKLRANPIASEFFKKKILYESLLNPVHYEDLPSGSNSNT